MKKERIWIIPNQSLFYHFVPATPVSNSGFLKRYKILCALCLWRSRPLPRQIWSQKPKKVNRLSKLCTRTLKPSQENAFLDALTSSLHLSERENNLQSAARTVWREWEAEPTMDRVAYGGPDYVDRIRLLGNGVVPRQAALAFQSLYKLYVNE